MSSIMRRRNGLKAYAAVVEGEVVVQTGEGLSDFQELERDLAAGRSDRFVFYAFDLLHVDGLDLRAVTLIDRKRALAELIADPASPLALSEHPEAEGSEVFARACAMELEGIVSKRRDGRYSSGRSDRWLKTTCRHRETFVVAGWAEKRGRFDGLYLGREEGGALTYAVKLEVGFSESDKRNLLARLRPLQTREQPITARRKFPKARWVQPAVLIDAEFRGRTSGGQLRHASYKGMREDLMDEAPKPRRPRRIPARSCSPTRPRRAIRSDRSSRTLSWCRTAPRPRARAAAACSRRT
jgi:bifunctional non-homologous end joining protein LigD